MHNLCRLWDGHPFNIGSTNILLKINLPTEFSFVYWHSQTVSVNLTKHEDKIQGYINNQQQDWSFPLDGVSCKIT
jgi:hypothetical protein